MTSAGVLDRLVTLLPRAAPQKASTGFAPAAYARGGVSLSDAKRDPLTVMREAQAAYIGNRHIRKAERLIAQRFSTVEWHLETADDEEVTDQSPAPYQAVRTIIEKPYTPLPGDPITATPRTRADLWSLTCRHMGICGMGYWYLDQATVLDGLPLQTLYINPARMAPSVDADGRLIGWVLDPDSRGGGTPLDVKDVIPFYLEPPDAGFLGTGLVASAMTMVELTSQVDRHAISVLRAGGRLSGVFAPKGDGVIEEEVYRQLVLDLRNAAENPDSARRMNVLRGPIEFTRMSATPTELDLAGIFALTRDEVSELWGVPRSQMGGATPQGLNSGDSKGYDEAILWQNAVGPRLRTFAETLQFRLLDRYATAGIVVQLEVDEPEFDDETPRFDRAQKAADLPLTNLERRELIGLDPFGDERDEEVWMPSTLTRVYPEAPAPAPTPPLAPFTGQPVPDLPFDAAKAKGEVAAMQRAVLGVLRATAAQVAERVREKAGHLARKPSDIAAVFDEARLERDLEQALEPFYRSVIAAAGKADLRAPLVDALLRKAGIRIKGIGETTRQRVAEIVRQGIDDGLGAAELGDRIEAASGLFDELRAETIARTETATVLNEAAAAQYRDLGIDRVVVHDGDDDDPCASADGQIWTVDEAEANPIAHPNCTRTFAPYVAAARAELAPVKADVGQPLNVTVNMPSGHRTVEGLKAELAVLEEEERKRLEEEEMNQRVADALLELARQVSAQNQKAVIVNLPEQAAPVVNNTVNVPEQPAPIVNVAAPLPAKASTDTVQQIAIVSMPPMPDVVAERDARGRLRVTEVDG